MKQFFAYIRVSTPKQGELGVSLQEQRHAIEQHAERSGLGIRQWFEEQQTAAKRGRPVFSQMLKQLMAGKADGVVIHKIDRSARNLKDWADLGELIDHGIDVHLAHEALDLRSRGGRLTADIQAVIAADYIRNLREETKKGFYGRLKQGIYPCPAPLGYIDQGAGKPKLPCPISAPLIRQAFERYATGRYSLRDLGVEMFNAGLRTKSGKRVGSNDLSRILNNLFYIGIIRIKKTGETFAGAHESLISQGLFERVQQALHGKMQRCTTAHAFLFRRLLKCRNCGYSLIGERQKGHTYYRCHTSDCPTVAVREDAVDAAVDGMLRALEFSDQEREYFAAAAEELRQHAVATDAALVQANRLRLSQIDTKLRRLTDAFLDDVLDKASIEERKTALLMERRRLEDQIAEIEGTGTAAEQLAEFLELAGRAYSLYEIALPDEKRELLQIVTSNRIVDGRTPMFTLATPFDLVAKRVKLENGGPHRSPRRTATRMRTLKKWLANQVIEGDLANRIKTFLENWKRQQSPQRVRRGTVIRHGLVYVPINDADETIPTIQAA